LAKFRGDLLSCRWRDIKHFRETFDLAERVRGIGQRTL
jgi:hypothetical protein